MVKLCGWASVASHQRMLHPIRGSLGWEREDPRDLLVVEPRRIIDLADRPLSAIVQNKLGQMTFAELGSRLKFKQSNDLSIAYIVFALRSLRTWILHHDCRFSPASAEHSMGYDCGKCL